MIRWAIFACGGRRRAGTEREAGAPVLAATWWSENRGAPALAPVAAGAGRAAGGLWPGCLGGGRGLGSGGGGRTSRAAFHGMPPASFPVGDHGQDDRAAAPPGFGTRVPAGVRQVCVAAVGLARAVRSGPGCGGGAQVGREVGDRGRTAGGCGRKTLLGTGGAAARDAYRRTAPAGGVQTYRPAASRHPFVQLAHRGLRHPGLPPVPCLLLAAASRRAGRRAWAARPPYAAQGRRLVNSPRSELPGALTGR